MDKLENVLSNIATEKVTTLDQLYEIQAKSAP